MSYNQRKITRNEMNDLLKSKGMMVKPKLRVGKFSIPWKAFSNIWCLVTIFWGATLGT